MEKVSRARIAYVFRFISLLTILFLVSVDDARAQIAVQANPTAIAINPITGKAYVANLNADSVSIISGTGVKNVQLVSKAHPNAIAVNPVTNMVYVSANGTNQVAIIDGSQELPIPTYVSVGISPSAIAVNPKTNKIYVATDGGSPL